MSSFAKIDEGLRLRVAQRKVAVPAKGSPTMPHWNPPVRHYRARALTGLLPPLLPPCLIAMPRRASPPLLAEPDNNLGNKSLCHLLHPAYSRLQVPCHTSFCYSLLRYSLLSCSLLRCAAGSLFENRLLVVSWLQELATHSSRRHASRLRRGPPRLRGTPHSRPHPRPRYHTAAHPPHARNPYPAI